MEVILNELSLHGQYPDVLTFQFAIDTVMQARKKTQQFGKELWCHSSLLQARVTHESNLYDALDRSSKMAVLGWLQQKGPFWEDSRQHSSDEYLECQSQDKIATDTGLGEAAYRSFAGSDYQVFSFESPNWKSNPIQVDWHRDDISISIDIANHWEITSLENALQTADTPVNSWQQLATIMRTRCSNLTFAENSFEPLDSQPFVDGAAKRIIELLKVLDKFKLCFDAQGQRTKEGQRLYQDHFMGDKAWFSDSSDSEKFEFKGELTFKHPTNKSEKLFCPWHGKVKTPQIRIHFSWPISFDEPLYILYIGSKITKK